MTEQLTLSLSCNCTEEFMPGTLEFYRSYRCSKIKGILLFVVVIQSLSGVQLFATAWTTAYQAPLSSLSPSLLKLMSIELVMLSNHLILCLPLLLLPSVFPSLRVFFNESTLYIRWPKYWSFSFSISPFKEYSGLISFRIDWFDLLAVQGTLEPSPASQFKSIISLMLSLFYRPTLISVHDNWSLNILCHCPSLGLEFFLI